MIVACRPGHELLYQDFAHDIVPYQPPAEWTDMTRNLSVDDKTAMQVAQFYLHDSLPSYAYIGPHTYPERWWDSEPWTARQQLIPFGTPFTVARDISLRPEKLALLIVRNTNKCNTGFRNWPHEHAVEVACSLQQLGFTVACVGRTGSALHLPNTINYLDLPLFQLVEKMRAADVIIGPQCGATHFATLCELPQVCWQTKREHAERMTSAWNPFNTPVRVLPSPDDSYWRKRMMWLPSAKDIVWQTMKLLSERNIR